MDFRDHSIITQVAFKAAVELSNDLNMANPEDQAQFEVTFSYLTNSLFNAVGEPEDRTAQVIQAHFPGTTVQSSSQTYASTPTPAILPGQLRVKGNQFGELPPWLYEAAAKDGVTEVYDNRDRVANSRRPWFKATSGGDNAPAYWPPRAQ